MEISELIWKEKGFMLDLVSLNGDGAFELFFKGNSLEEAIKGNYKKEEIWRNKLHPEVIFIEEYKCLEDALDRANNEQEIACIEERMSEIDTEEFIEEINKEVKP